MFTAWLNLRKWLADNSKTLRRSRREHGRHRALYRPALEQLESRITPTSDHFVLTVPSAVSAGSNFGMTVMAENVSNNVDATYAGTVTFISTDGQATVPANATLTNGVGTFTAILKTAGSQTLTATDTANSGITGIAAINVNAAPASQFTITAPSNVTSGQAFHFTVSALDSFGNVATGYTGTVHFAASDSQAVLPANNALVNGVGTFTATFNTPGNQTLTVSDTLASITGTSGTIIASTAVSPGNFSGTISSNTAFLNTSATYVINGNLTIASGISLTVGADVSVQIGIGEFDTTVTLTDDGTLTFASGDTVNFDCNSNQSQSSQIVVGSGGLVNASGTTFKSIQGNTTQIVVNTGGELQANNCTFTITDVDLADGSVLNSGDLINNAFNTTLYTPIGDVPLLTNNQSFEDVEINPGDSLVSGQSVTLTAMGTGSTANLLYLFPGNFVINQGATLAVETMAVPVQIGIGEFDTTVTLTDDGTLTFASGDTVNFDCNSNQSQSSQIVVGSGGLVNASGTTFKSIQGNTTQIVVNTGGELQANNCTFTITDVDLADGSVLNSGDLINNAFNTTLYTPIGDVPLLTNNQSFEDVEINPGDSLVSGQSVTLTAMGTGSTANLLYLFPGNFVINQGATLAVETMAVPVQIGIGEFDTTVTLTDDGTLTFASGDTVNFDCNSNQSQSSQIVVGSGGLVNASGTTFKSIQGNTTQIVVNTGGELQANNCTFTITDVDLADGSVLNSGDLINNAFNTTLYTPIGDVPLLTNNQSFEDVEINPGDSLVSGQSVTLTAMGTGSTANLLYLFPGNFVINQGATLAVETMAVPVQIGIGEFDTTVTLTDDGTLTFASGDTVNFDCNSNQSQSSQIVVGSGGLMNASGTTFKSIQGNTTQIVVNAGGELQANNCTFTITDVDLADGSILNSGDLINNAFNTTLYTPIGDVPLLTNNQSFEDVEINPGDSLVSGQSVTLTAMGTGSTANLLYLFPGNFVINQGATLAVETMAVPVQIGIGEFDTTVTLTDDGTLTFASGDTVNFDCNSNQSQSSQIVVGSGGLMNASGTTFKSIQGNTTQIVVNTGGELTANGSTFALNQLVLDNGTADTILSTVFDTQLAINSGATISIASNDFTNATIMASGNANTTINLSNNYWGTTNTTQIAAKITTSGATVQTQPILTLAPATALVITAPVAATAGNPVSITVTAENQSHNAVASYTGTVHFSSTDVQAVLPADATLVSGVGVFSVTLKTAGSQTLTAMDTGSSGLIAISGAINVSPATASKFAAVGIPASIAAGTPVSMTLTAQDQYGNTVAGYTGTVHFSSSDGQAALPANATLTDGVGIFSVTLKTAGSQSLTATDTGNATINGTSTITVFASAATHYSISGAPATAAPGAAASFTVTAVDQFGNIANGYSGTVAFATTDPLATPPNNATLTNGIGIFSATFNTPGTQTLTATDTNTAAITGSAMITVRPPVDVSWTGNAGTLNWTDANNWSGSAVPGPEDAVTIGVSVAGAITIGSGTQAVYSLTDNSAPLVISGGALVLEASSSVSQNITASGGTVTANGSQFNLNGTMTGGTLNFGSGGMLGGRRHA